MTTKLPKAYYIPSIGRLISLADYLDVYKQAKDNPGTKVKQTIIRWSGGTTDMVIAEIREGIHDRINLRANL